jgi:hypothetical protein
MWKDWGFAATLRSQARHFQHLAQRTAVGGEQEGCIRASIVFSVMSFEALFFREIIRGYIDRHRAEIAPKNLEKVEDGLNGKKGRFTGIWKAVTTWPELLTGANLAVGFQCVDFLKLVDYRNALVHGDIARQLAQSGTLAQEVETVANAELALHVIGEFEKHVAQHFGFSLPAWE